MPRGNVKIKFHFPHSSVSESSFDCTQKVANLNFLQIDILECCTMLQRSLFINKILARSVMRWGGRLQRNVGMKEAQHNKPHGLLIFNQYKVRNTHPIHWNGKHHPQMLYWTAKGTEHIVYIPFQINITACEHMDKYFYTNLTL